MNISGIGPSFGGFTYNPIKLNTDNLTNVHARDTEDTKVEKTANTRARQEMAGVAYQSQSNSDGSVRVKQLQAVNPASVRGAENFDF